LPKGLSAHGIRKASATAAATAGAATYELMGMFGRRTPATAAPYTEKVDKKPAGWQKPTKMLSLSQQHTSGRRREQKRKPPRGISAGDFGVLRGLRGENLNETSLSTCIDMFNKNLRTVPVPKRRLLSTEIAA
jgi:hypothetical protein